MTDGHRPANGQAPPVAVRVLIGFGALLLAAALAYAFVVRTPSPERSPIGPIQPAPPSSVK
jgi:hypothetical protein